MPGKKQYANGYERSAAGLDFDDPIRERAASLGATLVSEGPDALLEQIEEFLPESWRDQIRDFPMSAMVLGIGVGLYLGMKRGDEILTAGSSLITAAALANVGAVLSDKRAPEEE